jgi:molybdenum cofactor biosynthesis enzyme MoaA
MTSKTFCVAPFTGVEFRKNGQLAPCCRYTLPRSNSLWNFRDYDKWWNEYLDPMRQELLNGIEHEGCKNCWRDEKVGIKSYRQNLNEEFARYTDLVDPLLVPTYQMYNYGNFCNLKCIMCNPFASSQIETEYKQNQEEFVKVGVHYVFGTEIKWFRSNEFNTIKNNLLVNANQILIQGGEPFLSQDVIDLFKATQSPENIVLTVISNLTTFTDDIVELLKQFKKVELVVSLEGIESHNDYLRYGSSWNEILNNINKALTIPNVEFKIAHTFQRTSLASWIPLLQWATKLNLNMVSNILDDPTRLSVSGATDAEKQLFLLEVDNFLNAINQLHTDSKDHAHKFYLATVKSNVEKIKNYVESTVYDDKCNQDFWKYIDLLDSIRSTNFNQVFDQIYRTQVA